MSLFYFHKWATIIFLLFSELVILFAFWLLLTILLTLTMISRIEVTTKASKAVSLRVTLYIRQNFFKSRKSEFLRHKFVTGHTKNIWKARGDRACYIWNRMQLFIQFFNPSIRTNPFFVIYSMYEDKPSWMFLFSSISYKVYLLM